MLFERRLKPMAQAYFQSISKMQHYLVRNCWVIMYVTVE
jgi:hypothetical protein